MIDRIIAGVIENWYIVLLSLILLVAGTIQAYKKYGLKRVLLGKSNDDRELIYRNELNEIEWRPTLRSWKIIVTGGMSILSIFLLIMLLSLAFIYAHDVQATKDNDEKLCKEFRTVFPTIEQLEEYNKRELELSNITFNEERGTGNNRSG